MEATIWGSELGMEQQMKSTFYGLGYLMVGFRV